MSKKDFVKDAEIIHRMNQTDFTGAMEDAFVEFFKNNSRFDENRFRQACRGK